MGADRTGPFCSIHFSHSALQSIGMWSPPDVAFRAGMQARGPLINDPAPDKWERAYRGQSLDILLYVADDCPVSLARNVVLIKEPLVEAGLSIVTEEQGSKLTRGLHSTEHFGFADGISQPRLVGLPVPGSNDAPKLIYNPDDLLIRDHCGSHGSYLVFRKLEQNVALWHQHILTVARNTGRDPFYVAASLVGRFSDGTPLATSDAMLGKDVPDNDFDYSGDVEGARCPHYAHIRRMNDRTDGQHPNIARCSMSYGVRPDLHANGKMFALPENGVGLLFMAYQNDITTGFERLQQRANVPSEHALDAGPDPMISQPDRGTGRIGADTPNNVSTVPTTVTLRGGAYLYAPSVKSLETLRP